MPGKIFLSYIALLWSSLATTACFAAGSCPTSPPMEQAICTSPEIQAANAALNDLWERARQSLSKEDFRALLIAQRAWIRGVNENCSGDDLRDPEQLSTLQACVKGRILGRQVALTRAVTEKKVGFCDAFFSLWPEKALDFIKVRDLKASDVEGFSFEDGERVDYATMTKGIINGFKKNTLFSYEGRLFIEDYAQGGSMNCADLTLFLVDQENKILKEVYSPSEGCGHWNTGHSFVGHQGSLYIIWDMPKNIAVQIVQDGADDNRDYCSFSIVPDFRKAKISADCQDDICKKVVKLAPVLAARPDKVIDGIEEDCNGRECYVGFTGDENGAYRVDMNNDGNEIICSTGHFGGHMIFSDNFFRKGKNGKWEKFDELENLRGYGDDLRNYSSYHWVKNYNFIKSNGKTYWIIISENADFAFDFDIYKIENGAIHHIGMVKLTETPHSLS